MKKIIDKNYVYIVLVYIMLMFLLNDAGNLYKFLTFNVDAPDLQGGVMTAIEMRNEFFGSAYSYGLLLRDIANKNGLIIPLLVSITVLIYANYKNRYLKYSIGKDYCYEKALQRTKVKVLFANCILLSSVFLAYIIVSYVFTGLEYSEDVALNKINGLENLSDFSIGLLLFLEINCFSFFLGYILLMMADRFKSPIKIAICGLICINIISGIVEIFFGSNFSLTGSIDWIFHKNSQGYSLIVSYIYILLGYFVIKKFIPKQV